MSILPDSGTRTSYWDPFAHLRQSKLDGLKFGFQGLDLIGSICLIGGLDELYKDPPTCVPAELYGPNRLGSKLAACKCRKNPTYRNKHIQ